MHGLGNPTRGTNTELYVWYRRTILDVSHVFHVFIVWGYCLFEWTWMTTCTYKDGEPCSRSKLLLTDGMGWGTSLMSVHSLIYRAMNILLSPLSFFAAQCQWHGRRHQPAVLLCDAGPRTLRQDWRHLPFTLQVTATFRRGPCWANQCRNEQSMQVRTGLYDFFYSKQVTTFSFWQGLYAGNSPV